MRAAFVCFAAGCLGGLVNSLLVWQLGALGVTSALGVAIAPALTPAWLYPRIVWGGIWGLLFLLPLRRGGALLKGSILSLAPSAVQLFVVFPLKAHKGIAGLELGLATPAVVLVANWVWGVATALAIRAAR